MLTLIRGIPGSGKSTYAILLADKYDWIHLETDMYWENHGIPFDGALLQQAHKWCQEETKKWLDEGLSVVVSNTFTQLWEIKPYLEMTDRVDVLRMTKAYKPTHDVPQATIEKMKKRFQPYEGEEFIIND